MFADCDMNPCENGWCEETMTRYRCHCPIGFQGKQCHERKNKNKNCISYL